MSTQDVQDTAVRDRGEAMSPAVQDAQQATRDRIPSARPTVCGLWIVARDQVNLCESLQYAYRESEKIRAIPTTDQSPGTAPAPSSPVPPHPAPCSL
jgi:hypothetical protein